MITTSLSVCLGNTVEDEQDVFIGPSEGPLLIFGATGSGRTFALKTMFARLVSLWEESGDVVAPPWIFALEAMSGYGRVASHYGANHLRVRPGMGLEVVSAEHGGEQYAARPMVLSGKLCETGSTEALNHTLYELIHGKPVMGHVLADDVDLLASHEMGFGYLRWTFKYGADRGVLGAGVVADESRFSSNKDCKELLSATRRLLIMRTTNVDLLPKTVKWAIKRSRVQPEVLSALRQGEGFLVHKPKRGERQEPALRIQVRATEIEKRVFNTDPAKEAGYRG